MIVKAPSSPAKTPIFAIFNADDYREIAYYFATNRCAFTVLNGIVNPPNK